MSILIYLKPYYFLSQIKIRRYIFTIIFYHESLDNLIYILKSHERLCIIIEKREKLKIFFVSPFCGRWVSKDLSVTHISLPMCLFIVVHWLKESRNKFAVKEKSLPMLYLLQLYIIWEMDSALSLCAYSSYIAILTKDL